MAREGAPRPESRLETRSNTARPKKILWQGIAYAFIFEHEVPLTGLQESLIFVLLESLLEPAWEK